MNPAILVALAAVGLLAVMVYLGASERSNVNIEINQNKHELERMKFDQDFKSFSGNEEVNSPSSAEISAKKQQIQSLEEKKKAIELENEQRIKEIQASLDGLARNED